MVETRSFITPASQLVIMSARVCISDVPWNSMELYWMHPSVSSCTNVHALSYTFTWYFTLSGKLAFIVRTFAHFENFFMRKKNQNLDNVYKEWKLIQPHFDKKCKYTVFPFHRLPVMFHEAILMGERCSHQWLSFYETITHRQIYWCYFCIMILLPTGITSITMPVICKKDCMQTVCVCSNNVFLSSL